MIRFTCKEVHDFSVGAKYVFSVTTSEPDCPTGEAFIYCIRADAFEEGKMYDASFQEVVAPAPAAEPEPVKPSAEPEAAQEPHAEE